LARFSEVWRGKEAWNGKEAIDQVIALNPDIVVLDINMPVMSGTQAAIEIRRIAPHVKILFLTIHEAPELLSGLRAFAHGLSIQELFTALVEINDCLPCGALDILPGAPIFSCTNSMICEREAGFF